MEEITGAVGGFRATVHNWQKEMYMLTRRQDYGEKIHQFEPQRAQLAKAASLTAI